MESRHRKKIRLLQHKRRDEKFVYWLTCEQKKHDSRLWLRPVQNDGKLGVLLRQDRISNPNKYFLISNFLNDGLNFPVCFRNEIHFAWDWFFWYWITQFLNFLLEKRKFIQFGVHRSWASILQNKCEKIARIVIA